MGYRVKKIPYSNGSGWKLQHITYAGGRPKTKDIPKENWLTLGFHPKNTYEEARSRAKALNSHEHLKYHEQRRVRIMERLQTEARTIEAFFNADDVKDFEQTVLFRKGFNKKRASHWKKAREVICDLKIDPSEWAMKAVLFYTWFKDRQLSTSYVQKVRYTLNLWGTYNSYKYKRFFAPIPAPKGYDKQEINDSYLDSRDGRNLASDPLTPAQLEARRGSIPIECYNWLYLTVWFGLRAPEVDNIAKGIHFKITSQGGYQVLEVYQTKLKSLNREDRWKKIPCVRPEQLIGLEIIQKNKFRRPGTKLLKNNFGPEVRLHAGRKNFMDMMVEEFGHKLEHVSAWLGHQSLDMTWEHYRKKNMLRAPKKAA